MSHESAALLRRCFELLDDNGDSFLSLRELNKFMLALQLQPGTLEEFRAFCEETGASPELGLTMDDFTTAYYETSTEKLEQILMIHATEWERQRSVSSFRADGLPKVTYANETSPFHWFDPSEFLEVQEVVLVLTVCLAVVVCMLGLRGLRRCWRACTSEEKIMQREAHHLNLIGSTALQITEDLNTRLQKMAEQSSTFERKVVYNPGPEGTASGILKGWTAPPTNDELGK
jgi:hypothetical protein